MNPKYYKTYLEERRQARSGEGGGTKERWTRKEGKKEEGGSVHLGKEIFHGCRCHDDKGTAFPVATLFYPPPLPRTSSVSLHLPSALSPHHGRKSDRKSRNRTYVSPLFIFQFDRDQKAVTRNSNSPLKTTFAKGLTWRKEFRISRRGQCCWKGSEGGEGWLIPLHHVTHTHTYLASSPSRLSLAIQTTTSRLRSN